LLSLNYVHIEVAAFERIEHELHVPGVLTEGGLGAVVQMRGWRIQMEMGIERMIAAAVERIEHQRVKRPQKEYAARVGYGTVDIPHPILWLKLLVRIIDACLVPATVSSRDKIKSGVVTQGVIDRGNYRSAAAAPMLPFAVHNNRTVRGSANSEAAPVGMIVDIVARVKEQRFVPGRRTISSMSSCS